VDAGIEQWTRPLSVPRKSTDLSNYVEACIKQGSLTIIVGPFSTGHFSQLSSVTVWLSGSSSRLSLLIVVPDRE